MSNGLKQWDAEGVKWDETPPHQWDGGDFSPWTEQPTPTGLWTEQAAVAGIWTEQVKP